MAQAHAQIKKPGFLFGGNAQYSKPGGNFANGYQYGLGTEAFAGVGLGKTYLVGTIGASFYKAENNGSGNITYLPIKGGIRQFIIGRQVFVNADLGVATVKSKEFNEKRFTRGIGAGVRLFGLEASMYYDGWKAINSSGFSNNLNFKLGASFVF